MPFRLMKTRGTALSVTGQPGPPSLDFRPPLRIFRPPVHNVILERGHSMVVPRRRDLVNALVCAVLVGCGGTEPAVPTTIRLGPTEIAFTALTQQRQLTPAVLDQNGSVLKEVEITWSSENVAVASVTAGLITAQGLGSTRITATAGAATASLNVRVAQVPAELRRISGESQTGTAGTALPAPLVVQVVDVTHRPIAGVTIKFSTPAATFQDSTAVTDAEGRAMTVVTVRRAGNFQVLATVVGATGTPLTTTFNEIGTPAPAAQLLIYKNNNPTVRPGIYTQPVVLVTDAFGNGIAGVALRFDVTAGGGVVGSYDDRANASATYTRSTGPDGTATVDWLVESVGEHHVTVTAVNASIAGSPALLSALVTNGFPPGYEIDVRFLSPISTSQAEAFARAERRWEQHIVDDLSGYTVTFPSVCGEGTPDFNDDVDDLVILVELASIDGPGHVLGSAGPCVIRGPVENNLPLVGVMYFDVDDLTLLESEDLLDDVILHEMGHVLGFGTLWELKHLLVGPARTGGTDPYFNGAATLGAFNLAGGTSYIGNKVPVENTGGSSTADSHWRESVLGNELMTGYANSGANPLSAITISSLADLGYNVDVSGADPFNFSPAFRRSTQGSSVLLKDDIYRGPITQIDRSGRVTKSLIR